ncbi:MAG TPA: 5-oxoprolinase subunit PxpB [Chloroflexota bacterium]|nr:5-oxoprolinase subunit PxpB [Chloroflexota bacterium]
MLRDEDVADRMIRPAGDAGIMLDLGSTPDASINRRVHAAARQLHRDLEGYAIEIIPAYAALLVTYDPVRHTYEDLAAIARRAVAGAADMPPQGRRRFTVPAVYGREDGPDLAEVAALHDMSPDDVIALHAGRDYPIYCLGFSPGFPYLGGLDERLHTPRLDRPRSRVPAGSVAIGGSQTGVYPTSTPGGWRLIGRTPLTLFDVRVQPPVPYAPGDVIRFQPIGRDEFDRRRGQMPVGEVIS